MTIVIADNPPRLLVGSAMYLPDCPLNLTSIRQGRHCGSCIDASAALFGDGAALAAEYVRRFPKGVDAIKGQLADWLDENAEFLDLPAHLRPAVGQAVRDGCPDAATTARPVEALS